MQIPTPVDIPDMEADFCGEGINVESFLNSNSLDKLGKEVILEIFSKSK